MQYKICSIAILCVRQNIAAAIGPYYNPRHSWPRFFSSLTLSFFYFISTTGAHLTTRISLVIAVGSEEEDLLKKIAKDRRRSAFRLAKNGGSRFATRTYLVQ